MPATLAALHDNVSAALRTALIAVPGIPPVAQRAWENRTFTPTEGVPYIRDTLLWQPTDPASLGRLALMRTTFSYQIDSYLLLGEGRTAGTARVGALLLAFNPGLDLNYNGQVVRIERSGQRGSGRPEGTFWVVTFMVDGVADAPNPY